MKTTNRLNLKGQLIECKEGNERVKGILRRKIKSLKKDVDTEKNIHLSQLSNARLKEDEEILDLLED